MSWTIGKIVLPQAPNKVAKKTIASIKKIPYLVEYPWLMSMGADATELQIEGEALGQVNETLWTSYFQRLEKYVKQPMTIDEVLLDDSADYGTWTGNGTSTFKNTGTQYVKFLNSVYVIWGAAGNISRDFATNKDFTDHNIVSIWFKGATAENFKVTFYNEPYASRANGYRFYPTCDTTWKQTTIARSSGDGSPYISNNVGTPTGWHKIRSVVIEPSMQSEVVDSDIYYIDAFYIGHGWKLAAPGTRYDGIYAINTFEINEGGGEVRSLAYKMTLLDKTPFFGVT